ncbi:uncharacterized protein LOC129719752 [Wyeomyia smithii]|uniref:uncharacterized protein LOC129719752 n=1 Tax=Wyeomyia smithii TaxID=174621 RepID=UPI002467E006|nr:uncharacterized protein LOC129719752 [Wyeomyia smithii]
MGNPLSPALADLVMENLLDSVLRILDFKPPFIWKYVDDLLMSIPPDKIQQVMDIFNNHNPHIQFTYELEIDKRIPFLDMLRISEFLDIIRTDDQQIKTEWYMKPIASGRFLNYNSQHPLHQKINVATNFINRVQRLSTNLEDAEINAIIDKQLNLNSYPKGLRRRLINRKQQHNKIAEPLPNNSRNLENTYRSITYIPNLSHKIDKQLKNEYPNIRLATHNINTVGKLFTKVKDPVTNDFQSNVIYSIPCINCEACFIGMTTNKLKTRISRHKTHYNALDKLLAEKTATTTDTDYTDTQIATLKEKTALMNHSITLNHRFDLNHTKILDKYKKQQSLPYLEVCHIMTTENSINKRIDTQGLNSIYAVIHTLKNTAK